MALAVSVVGTGNLASHFIPAIQRSSSLELRQVLGRNSRDAVRILGDDASKFVEDYQELKDDIDFIFLMVNDASIPSVSYLLTSVIPAETCIVHFSGVADLAVIDPYFKRTACIWPVGSISSLDKKLDLKDIPLCITGSTSSIESELAEALMEVSPQVYVVAEADKSALHLSAVMVNNFSNHLYHLSDLFLAARGLDSSILKPIIAQTASKVQQADAASMQTGPAIRGDVETMEKHIRLLEGDSDLQHIYKILSESIRKMSSK